MEPSDRDLMGRLARGEKEALDGLMQRHYARLYRVALSYLRDPDEALDAVQETFVRAYENAARWRPDSEVLPWLLRIAVNHSIDRYRRARRRSRDVEPLDEPEHGERAAQGEISPEGRVLGRELGERIGEALASLPEQQRAVFVLRHYEEMSLDEISAALGIRLGTVKSSLHRAVHRLRHRLREVRP